MRTSAALLASFFAACSSDVGELPPTTTRDASARLDARTTTTAPDASVADGGAVDAGGSADAGTGRQLTTLNVYNNGQPAPGAEVFSSDVDGQLIDEGETGVNGQALLMVPPNGMVTMAVTFGASRVVWSYVGVEPGEELHLGRRVPPLPGGDPMQMVTTASVTIDLPPPAAAQISYDAGCGATSADTSTNPQMLPISGSCVDVTGRFSVLVVARGPSGLAIAYALAADITPNPGAPTTSVRPGAWRTDFQRIPVTLTGNRSGAASTAVFTTSLHASVPYGGPNTASAIGAGGAQLDALLPRDFAQGVLTQALVNFGPMGAQNQIIWGQRTRSSIPTSYTIDLQRDLVPSIAGANFNRTDSARPALDWTYDGDATGADGSFARYVFDDAGTRHSWFVLLPPNATRHQMPVIPERLAAYRPTTQAQYEDVQVLLIETDHYEGFDAFRKSDGPFFLQSATFQGDLTFAIAFENVRP